MVFIVATNVVVSRQPERKPTGRMHARANLSCIQRLTTSSPLHVNLAGF